MNFAVQVFSLRCFCVLLFLSCAFQNSVSGQQINPDKSSGIPTSIRTQQSDPVVGHESWTSITLEGSDLVPKTAVKAPGTADVPQNSFVRELYQLQWRPNDPLDVYVIRPKNVAKPPVVLYLYSYPQDTDRFKDDRWCTTVTTGGYAAVGFVSALTGHRYHDRPMKEWFVSELQESLATSTHDVQMILNFLSTRNDLDLDRVGIFGQGSGAAIAILTAAADPRIQAIDLLEPWGDWPDWLAHSKVVPESERAAYLKPEFLAKVAALDPVTWLPSVKAARIRIQNLRRDPANPEPAQLRLEAAAPQRTEIEQYGDNRAFYQAAAGGKNFDWMKQQLQPDAKTAADSAPRVRYHPPMGDPPAVIPASKQ